MKRSLFLKCINAAILFGLVAPTAQAFSATNQNGLRKRAIEYARSTGVDFGKGIRSAYRGTASGLKRVGAGLALGREKAITRAKKEQEHVMEGAKAALKRMKGKKLSKKEQYHLYSFEKRTGALLALLFLLVGTTWILTRPTDDGDVPGPPGPPPGPPAPVVAPEPRPAEEPPAPPLTASRFGDPLSTSEVGPPPIPSEEPPAPPLGASRLEGDPLSTSRVGEAPIPSEEPPAPSLGASRFGAPLSMSEVSPLPAEEESDVSTPPDGSPERPLSPRAPTKEEELARALEARRRALAESELEESRLGASSLFGPEAPAASSPAPSKSVAELHVEISRLQDRREDFPPASPRRGQLTSQIRQLEAEIRRKEQRETTGAEAAADLEARRRRAAEQVSSAERRLEETPVEGPEEEEDPDSSWSQSQLQ
ncbi:hypothetical protein E3J61_00080 [Candidatus Dependentiae bacterium]|nr:MAG: hypothetical protein E3J61_00080 [Candidatus Dependentiae bacterium]